MNRKWPGLDKNWPGLDKKWLGLDRRWPGQGGKWPDLDRKWPGLDIKWPGLGGKWPGLDRKWPTESNRSLIREVSSEYGKRIPINLAVNKKVGRKSFATHAKKWPTQSKFQHLGGGLGPKKRKKP